MIRVGMYASYRAEAPKLGHGRSSHTGRTLRERLLKTTSEVAQCSSNDLAPPEVGAFVHAHVPGSQLVTLNATGHCPQLAAPQETAAAIASFAGAVG